MKITRIELQKNDNSRFNLYSDDKFVGGVSAENLSKYGYGEFEISEEDLARLLEKEDVDKAYKKVFRYSAKAIKTEKEIRDYMYKNKIDPSLHDNIIEELVKLGLIDDKRYLEMYLEDKFNFSTDGPMKLINKLFLKGFERKEIEPYLYKYEEKIKSNLNKLIETKTKNSKDYDKNKLVRFLISKGYDYSTINSALGDFYSDDF